MAAPEQLTLEAAVGAISSFQQRLASLAGDAEAFAASHLPADDDGARAAMLEASQRARQTLVAFANATAPIVAFIGGRGGAGGEGTGAGGGGGGGGGGATAEAAALRAPSAPQEETQGGGRGDDREEPPARKCARVAAGTGARAEAAAAATAAAAAPPPNDAAPRAAALFSSPSPSSSSSETFPAPSSSTSSEDDDEDGGESSGGDGAGDAAAGGGGRGGGGQDDGFVFASQPVTKFMLSGRKIQFPLSVMRSLRLNEGAADSVKRGTGGAESRTELYRFAVFALRSAPARRGPSSWEPPARDAPGTQAFNTDLSSYNCHSETYGTTIRHSLAGVARCFRRRGDNGVRTVAQEGALCDAEVGDELVFARRGMDRELFVWLVKKAQGCNEGGGRGDDREEPRSVGGDGAGEGAAAGAGGGQDDGFVFASQNVTKYVVSQKTIHFHASVARALRLNGDAPDSAQRGKRAETTKESYRFAVFALRSAPARRGSSSWEPPARGAPGTQAIDSDVKYDTYVRNHGVIEDSYRLSGMTRCFRRRGERDVGGSAQEEGALRDAEVGDELVFARRGMDRELFIWLVKGTQAFNEGDERGDDNEEPPARKRARVAAGTGARAAAAAAATAAQPPQNEAEPRAAALFSSSSSSETFPSPSFSTSSEDNDDGGSSGGGGGAGNGTGAAGRGGGRDDGFVFASQPVTKFMHARRKIEFNSSVSRVLRLSGGAPDSVQRGQRNAASRTESYRFAVFALRSAPARRGPSSWEAPARGAPGTQVFDSDVVSYAIPRKGGGIRVKHKLLPSGPCFQRRGDKGIATAEQEGALRDAEVGDELVFARRGMDRELFLWLVKKTTQG